MKNPPPLEPNREGLRQPTTADWLRLAGMQKTAETTPTITLHRNSDFLIGAVQQYRKAVAPFLNGFGIEALYLRTTTGTVERYVDLRSSGKIAFEEGKLQLQKTNLLPISSKSEYVDGSGNRLRAQIVAFVSGDANCDQQAIKSYCRLILQDLVREERRLTHLKVDRGITAFEAIQQRYKINLVKFGTFALRATSIVARAVSARSCIIGTVHDGRLLADYFYAATGGNKYSTTRILDGSEIGRVERIREPNADGQFSPIVLTGKDLSKSSMRGLFSDKDTEHLIENDYYVLAPIAFESDALAFVLVAFDPASIGLTEAAKSFLNRVVRALSEPAKYLHQRRTNNMIVEPVFRSRETRIIENQAFLMMPFSEPWSAPVSQIVKELLGEHGINVLRADDLYGENVMEDVWSGIVRSKYIVADVTGRNPNVFYELGIAHTIGRSTILLTQKIEDIPFDTKHLRHVHYSNDLTGFDAIRKGVRGFVMSKK